MGKRRQLPTTAIINAFNSLTTEQKEFVVDYIKSQVAPKQAKKASTRRQVKQEDGYSATGSPANAA